MVLNGQELSMTVVGKSGGGMLVGVSIITTPPINSSTLSINNPSTTAAGVLHLFSFKTPILHHCTFVMRNQYHLAHS